MNTFNESNTIEAMLIEAAQKAADALGNIVKGKE